VRLVDGDGNVLASEPFYQTGGAQALPSGRVAIRIAPDGTFSSAPVELPVPTAAPDNVFVVVHIDRVHYRLGEVEQASLPGPSHSTVASLRDNAYYAQVTDVQPRTSYGESDVVITGRAVDRRTQQPLGNVPLKLILAVRGYERSVDVFSDASGSFAYRFTPQSYDGGEFVVSAIHPESFERPDHGRFLISRVSVKPGKVLLQALRNETQPIALSVHAAPGSSATNVRMAVLSSDQPTGELPRGVTITPGPPVSVPSGKSANLLLQVASDPTAPDLGTFVVRVVSDERGNEPLALVDVDYRFYDASAPELTSALYPKPNYVETSAARDSVVLETVQLQNKGLGAAREVKVQLLTADGAALPAWIALASPGAIGTVPAGESVSVDVSIAPTAQVAEGIYRFKLRVSSANLREGDVNVFVSVTQGGTGNALFKMADFYTGLLKDGVLVEGLAGATISLQNEKVVSQTFRRETDAVGEAYFPDLPVGRYRFRATAPGHEEATGVIQVKPGLTVSQPLFLNNELVKVQWSVRETSIVDRYEISLRSTFETFVPAPVVIIEPQVTNLPKLQAGDIFYGELTITNHGLVRADNVRPQLPGTDKYLQYEFLAEIPESLEARQRVTIPYRIHALRSLEPDGASSGGGCFNYAAGMALPYSFTCANGAISSAVASALWSFANGASCALGALGQLLSSVIPGFGDGSSNGGTGQVGGGPPASGGGSNGFGSVGFPSFVPAYESLPGAKCVPGCNGKCCNAGGVPAGGGGGCGDYCAGPRNP
jgi:hypothetical protein